VSIQKKKFTAVINEVEGQFMAKCPEVGTESQGPTVDAALDNLREATEIYLSVFPLKSMGEPIFKTFEAEVKEHV
jgi:predicted RNase H-like HicB family nuclease